MRDAQHHRMHVQRIYPSGAEEWYCPVCGRRLVLQWPPAYARLVLIPGDEHAFHSGSKGGRGVQADENRPEAEADELRPWLRWMRDAGLID
jgi:hypothetical protein